MTTNQATSFHLAFGIVPINCAYNVKIGARNTEIVNTLEQVDYGYTVIPIGSIGPLIIQNVVIDSRDMVNLVMYNCSDSAVKIKSGDLLANVVVADLRKIRYMGEE